MHFLFQNITQVQSTFKCLQKFQGKLWLLRYATYVRCQLKFKVNTMKTLLLSTLFTICFTLNPTLTLLQYDPLLFQLKFTSPVEKPKFQLLYNNIDNISYIFLTQQQLSDKYLLEAHIDGLQSTSSIEIYSLLFNSPLRVGEKQLQVQSYTLLARKHIVQISFPVGFGIFVLVGAYLFNTITQIGKLSIEFIHVYILFMFKSKMSTGLYHQLYIGMLLLPPRQILIHQGFNGQKFILVCLSVPLMLLFVMGLAGFIVFKWARSKERSICQNIVYQELVFNAFLKGTHIFMFNFLFNSLQFIGYLQENNLPFILDIKGIGLALIYFNLTTHAAILYLVLYVLNPKIGQSKHSWKQSIRSEQFTSFRNLHARVKIENWYKRNYSLFKIVKGIILIAVYFWDNTYQYTVLILQFAHLFYTFTVRPFKEEFYLNVKIICRLLFFAEYLFIVVGALYFSISSITYNYYTTKKFTTARDCLFLVVIFLLFIGVFLQLYFKCENLNYRIKLVKQANQYKLCFVKKPRSDSDSKVHRNKTKGKIISENSKQQSKRIDFLSDPAFSPDKKDEAKREMVRGKSKTKTERNTVDQHEKIFHRKNSSALQREYVKGIRNNPTLNKQALLDQIADIK